MVVIRYFSIQKNAEVESYISMIISSNGPQNIGQIHTHFRSGNLFLSPEEYQRDCAWKLQQKQLLIDTIFRGMDIPKFYLWKIDEIALANGYPEGRTKTLYREILEKKRRENDDPTPYLFEVVDGQQRIRTFLEFMGADSSNSATYRGAWLDPFASLADTPMAKGKKYNHLNADQQIRFDQSQLTVMVLENATIDEIRDMFLRLQNGTPLNAQQKRDAMGSNIGREAQKLANLSFFKQSVNFDASNANHHLVASQLLQLELKGKIVSCTSQQLDKLYEQYKSVPVDTSAISKAKNTLRILERVFPEKNPHLNKNYAISLYWLLSRMLINYNISADQYSRIRKNFEKLDVARITARDRDYSRKEDELYEDLSLAMSRGNAAVDGISTRHDVVGQFLFDGVNFEEKPKLDPQRNFSHEEKLILYSQAQGICQLGTNNGSVCDHKITFDDAVVDHILPHSKGGRTELANGRIAFKSCNIARSNRDDFNPEKECCQLVKPDSV
jgi:hypothetical protein